MHLNVESASLASSVCQLWLNERGRSGAMRQLAVCVAAAQIHRQRRMNKAASGCA